jgi:hypothetical protein
MRREREREATLEERNHVATACCYLEPFPAGGAVFLEARYINAFGDVVQHPFPS